MRLEPREGDEMRSESQAGARSGKPHGRGKDLGVIFQSTTPPPNPTLATDWRSRWIRIHFLRLTSQNLVLGLDLCQRTSEEIKDDS